MPKLILPTLQPKYIKIAKYITLSIIVASFLSLIYYLYRLPLPQNIRVTNINSYSLTISWLTSKPTWGCVTASADDHKTRHCHYHQSLTHLIPLSDLQPQTTYTLKITNGLRSTQQILPQVTTPTLNQDQPPLPDPAYGSIKWLNTNQPIPNALIYISNPNQPTTTLVTLTNDLGNWSIDLSNLIPLDNYLAIEVVINPQLQTLNRFPTESHAPLPTLSIPNP